MQDIQLIDIAKIVIDAGTQQRDYDKDVVEDYTNLVKEEFDLPPVEVVYTGKKYILWDGFHRYMAHLNAEADSIMANVQGGTVDDAIFLSFSANKAHGLRRPADSIKRIVMTILSDKKWRSRLKTQKEIADWVGLSEGRISQIKEEMAGNYESLGAKDSASTPSKTPISEETGNGSCESVTPKPTTRDAKPMKDGAGNDIPRKLVDVFLKGKEIQSMSRALSTIENEVINLHSVHNPAMRHFPFDRFKVDIENARNDIRCAEPYAVCPYCSGEAKGCKACKASGWVTKGIYENAPRELK